MRFYLGVLGRTRTDMSVTSPDFESGAYTNFATPAMVREIISGRLLARQTLESESSGQKAVGTFRSAFCLLLTAYYFLAFRYRGVIETELLSGDVCPLPSL